MSYYSNASQLYFDFVYDQYLNEHSESKYLLDLINVIERSVVLDYIHKRTSAKIEEKYDFYIYSPGPKR